MKNLNMLTVCQDRNPRSLEKARTYVNGSRNTRIAMTEIGTKGLIKVGMLEEQYLVWTESIRVNCTKQEGSDDSLFT